MATRKTKATDKNNTYNEDSIKVKQFPDNVRLRPTMYIGELGINGNDHLAKEVIDNATDEALNGYGKLITVSISNDKGYCKVVDEGRGIPPKAIEKAFTVLHSSGKFDKDSYSVSSGLNGCGTTAVNALSSKFKITTHADGKEYKQNFEKGIKSTELSKGVKTEVTKGTTVVFYPDETIMETTQFDKDYLKNELEMKSYVNAGIKYIFNDVDIKKSFTYFHKNGIAEYITSMSKTLLVDPVRFTSLIKTKRKTKEINIEVDVSLSWQNNESEVIKSFCNSLFTSDGGTHVTGLKLGIINVVKNYITNNNLLTKKDSDLEISGDDVRTGLIAVVAVKHPDPLYDSQTKNKITNTELQGAVQRAVNDELAKWAEEHQKEMKVICQKVITAAKASLAARKAKELVNKKNDAFSAISDLSKLAGCNSKNPEERELFIVEGNSAGGTAKKCRDKQYQAIYALRGKPLNSNNATKIKILENKELADLTYILTGKRDCLDEEFTPENLKYYKVIVMADADVDGAHISSLMLSFFYKHMKDLILNGNVYVAMPPLYSILENKKRRYFLDDKEYNDYISEIIRKEFEFKVDGKKKTKTENINLLLNKLEKYVNKLNEYHNDKGMNKYILEEASIYKYNNPDCENKDILKHIKSEGDLTSTKNSEGKLIISGLYKSSYVEFESKLLYKYVNELLNFCSSIKLSLNTEIKYKNSNIGNPCKAYEDLYEIATPKSRVRLKGLGRHFAPYNSNII